MFTYSNYIPGILDNIDWKIKTLFLHNYYHYSLLFGTGCRNIGCDEVLKGLIALFGRTVGPTKRVIAGAISATVSVDRD